MKVASIAENLIVRATSGQGDRPAGNSPSRFGTVNVGTINGRGKVAEMLIRQEVDLCCLQETRWSGGSINLVKGEDSIFKFL